METVNTAIAGLILGYLLDLLLGDPAWLPHPIVLFGKMVHHCEKLLRRGSVLIAKGALGAFALVGITFVLFFGLMHWVKQLPLVVGIGITALFVFYGLANRTLIWEVRNVFKSLEKDIDSGRNAVGRIVGRDTSALTDAQIRKAALETLSENLSDGVVAPLFYYALLGIPGMMAYKMVNTLDSMWGYKNERFLLFGRAAARLDDVANFIPSRLTALLMATVSFSWRSFDFIVRFGSKHTSPNSGYPEAALAGILNCQFGGGSYYGGVFHSKPTIGEYSRTFTMEDMQVATRVNHLVTLVAVLIISLTLTLLP
ncbi:adenosylcobinamide-phosphate synthase CbiB [Acetobacteroides hydrogenigenes]|uniref:Cobalamin biosynthesis protein CobD n=1 Tax=Acetobacteroides hydrogenigenes TaxID=979970 RepID=A0A4R2E8C6_9BACT|nr:adenosylcobinamide-phosphate synthase CbiB [Acetobacteroides hydrogenigenes]TCN63927.1 adenosylcobinamide-phosphate synthase [Acetobacteroides hydrogenigenes]